MLRRCVRELALIPSVKRRTWRQVPFFLSSRNEFSNASGSNSTKKAAVPISPPPPPPPQENTGSWTGRDLLMLLVGSAIVGAASTAAYQQFQGNDKKTSEDLKTSAEQVVELKPATVEASVEIMEDSNMLHPPPRDVEVEGTTVSEIGSAKDQQPILDENEPGKLSQDTLPVIDDQMKHSKPSSQDGQTMDSKEVIVEENINNGSSDVQTDNVASDVVVSVESDASAAPLIDTADMKVPKDPIHTDAVEQKSLAETYLLQDVELSKDGGSSDVVKKIETSNVEMHSSNQHQKIETANVEMHSSNEKPTSETASEERRVTGSSDEGKVVLDIIEAIHAAERKQAESDASIFLEEKKKLKEKYEKELKDTRARELMYAEEAAILEKELKKEKVKSAAAIKALQETAEQNLREELQRKEDEVGRKLEMVQELAKAELAAAIAKEKATQIEQIAEADLNIDALCMAFYARSEEARQSHAVHKLALGTLALEEALSKGLPIRTEVDSLRKSLDGIDKDSLLELALSSLPEEVLDQGTDSQLKLEEKFNSLTAALRHYSLIPAGGGGILAHAVAHVASSLKMKEDESGDGVEALIARVEKFIVNGELAAAANALEGGLNGSEAEEFVTEWVTRARARAIAEQTLTLLHSYASSITFS